jgi:hypothetical protein
MKSCQDVIVEGLDDPREEKNKTAGLDIDEWLAENADEIVDKFSDRLKQDWDSKQRELVANIHSDVAAFYKRGSETLACPADSRRPH